MLKCENCGHVFEEDFAIERRFRNRLGEEESPPEYLCPNCHKSETVPVERCKLCGEWHDYRDVYSDVCVSCADDLQRKFVDHVKRHFTIYEVEFLRNHADIGGLL